MKQQFVKSIRWISASRGVPLVALAVLGLVTVMPGWVRAQSETTTTFTSPLPGGQHGEHGGPNDEIRELLDSIVDRDEILAGVLGITVDELAAAKEAGTSLDELIANAGLDKETVRTEIKAAITDAVEQAVADGTITQEQADLILTPPAPPQHDGESGHGGPGHHGPGGGDHDPQATPTPTLIATAPAEGTTTATPEAAATAEGTSAGTAATTGTSDSSDRPRPHHDHQAPPQNSDTGSSSSSDSTTSTTSTTNSSESTTASTSSDTTSSTSDSTATNDGPSSNEQAANDRPDRGSHQRPGR